MMKKIWLTLFFIPALSFAQVQSYNGTNKGSIEKENTDRQIERNRQEVNSPNTDLKISPTQPVKIYTDPNVRINLESSLMGLYMLEDGKGFTGVKFTKWIEVAFLKEVGGNRWAMQAGFEVPLDTAYVGQTNWALGAGLQLNSKDHGPKVSFYGNGGLEYHISESWKAQGMAQYVIGGDFGLIGGIGFSW
jgi:hypothetical protein